jgi:hypothetical protein
MRRINVEWDEDSIDHIWKHHVEPEEVEQTWKVVTFSAEAVEERIAYWGATIVVDICLSSWHANRQVVFELLPRET